MKKKYLMLSLIILIIFAFGKKVYAILDEETDFSQDYLSWLELSDEEKKNVIEPFPVEIDYNKIQNTTFRSNLKIKSNIIPAKYDLRDYIEVEIKNQKSTEDCWTYATNSAIETFLALRDENWNFSERHINYTTASNSTIQGTPNSLDRKLTDGGNANTSFAYLSRGDGPILEEDMPFEENNDQINLYDLPTNIAIKHVEGMKIFPSIIKSYDINGNIVYKNSKNIEYSISEVQDIRDDIKKHIMKNGGIISLIYSSKKQPYYNSSTYAYNSNNVSNSTNHVVTIIGWDDEYSKDNFINKPSSDGAYIVLNSWGENWGDNGIFYISYEDILIEKNLAGITAVSNIDYDNIYQYDTGKLSGTLKYQYSANVFKSVQDEELTEIMIGMLSNQNVDIYITKNVNDMNVELLTPVIKNVYLNAGYNTIKLVTPIELNKGDKFSIIVKITDFTTRGVALESNENYPSVRSNIGESFASRNGINWTDLYSENLYQNYSIKAFTQTKEKNIEISDITWIKNNIENRYSFTINTSYTKNNSIVNLKIVDSSKNDVTEKFRIKGNIIRGKGSYIKLIPKSTLESGEYNLKISIGDLENTDKTFQYEKNVSNISSKKYEIDGQYILKITSNTTLQEFKNNIDVNGEYIIIEDGEILTSENSIIKTGQTLILENEQYNLVIAGDLNGDGKIKASDLSIIKSYIIGKRQLSNSYAKAADLNYDGKIKASDLSKLKRIIVNGN